MITEYNNVRVITNGTEDNAPEDNAPGDYALVRVTVNVGAGFTVLKEGWVLVGCSYVEKCRAVPSFVDLVYCFRGAP